jgi:hypothetical protein
MLMLMCISVYIATKKLDASIFVLIYKKIKFIFKKAIQNQEIMLLLQNENSNLKELQNGFEI